MMGPKKLSTIRSEIEAALAETGKDPIQWLEDRIQELQKQPTRHQKKGTEILQMIRRVLERPNKRAARRPTRVRANPAQ